MFVFRVFWEETKRTKILTKRLHFNLEKKKNNRELIIIGRFLSHTNLLSSSSFSFSEEEEEHSERTARVFRRRESCFALLLRRRPLFVREAHEWWFLLNPSFYSHLQFSLPLASDFKFEIRFVCVYFF